MASRDFFIRAAIEWAGVVAAVRATPPDGGEPVRAAVAGLTRELAWCDVLVAAGRPAAALASLHAALRDAVGPEPPDGDDMEGAAAALLGRMRAAVAARHPCAGVCRSPVYSPLYVSASFCRTG